MPMTQVTYTVTTDYAEQNTSRIHRVFEELRALHRTDIEYRVFVQDNGKTFMHLLLCANEEAGKIFESLESFIAFRTGLTKNVLEVPPSAINLTLIGSTSDIFSR